MFSTYMFGALTVGMGITGNLWVFYALMFLLGLSVPLFSTPFMTLIQETVEPAKHGRVFSYVSIVMALATPIGMAAFGPLADTVSVQTLLVVGGFATIGFMTVAVLLPSGKAAFAMAREGPAPEPEPDEPPVTAVA